MAASSSRLRWLLVLFLLGGGLVALVLVGLGVWAGFAVKRAAAVWPAELAPEVVPEAPLPVDPDARVRLDRLMELVPEELDNSNLGDALEAIGPPDYQLPDGVGPALEAMDAVVECSGLQMESFGWCGPGAMWRPIAPTRPPPRCCARPAWACSSRRVAATC